MPVSAASSCRVTRFSLLLFRLLLRLAAVFLLLGLRLLLGGGLGLLLGGGLGLLRRLGLGSGLLGRGGLLLRLGLLFCLRGRGGLLAAGKVGVEAVLGVLAGQGLQQDVELFFLKRAGGLIGFCRSRPETVSTDLFWRACRTPWQHQRSCI